MNLRCMVGQCPLQGTQGQALIETAPQVPAANAAREDIQQYRQLDKLRTQPNVRDIRHPDLFWTHDLQLLH